MICSTISFVLMLSCCICLVNSFPAPGETLNDYWRPDKYPRLCSAPEIRSSIDIIFFGESFEICCFHDQAIFSFAIYNSETNIRVWKNEAPENKTSVSAEDGTVGYQANVSVTPTPEWGHKLLIRCYDGDVTPENSTEDVGESDGKIKNIDDPPAGGKPNLKVAIDGGVSHGGKIYPVNGSIVTITCEANIDNNSTGLEMLAWNLYKDTPLEDVSDLAQAVESEEATENNQKKIKTMITYTFTADSAYATLSCFTYDPRDPFDTLDLHTYCKQTDNYCSITEKIKPQPAIRVKVKVIDGVAQDPDQPWLYTGMSGNIVNLSCEAEQETGIIFLVKFSYFSGTENSYISDGPSVTYFGTPGNYESMYHTFQLTTELQHMQYLCLGYDPHLAEIGVEDMLFGCLTGEQDPERGYYCARAPHIRLLRQYDPDFDDDYNNKTVKRTDGRNPRSNDSYFRLFLLVGIIVVISLCMPVNHKNNRGEEGEVKEIDENMIDPFDLMSRKIASRPVPKKSNNDLDPESLGGVKRHSGARLSVLMMPREADNIRQSTELDMFTLSSEQENNESDLGDMDKLSTDV